MVFRRATTPDPRKTPPPRAIPSIAGKLSGPQNGRRLPPPRRHWFLAIVAWAIEMLPPLMISPPPCPLPASPLDCREPPEPPQASFPETVLLIIVTIPPLIAIPPPLP